MKAVNIIFPHQLFEESPLLHNGLDIYLIEEFLYFKQYPFHKTKIAFHRASMKAYEQYLLQKGKRVNYIDAQHPLADIRNFDSEIQKENIGEIQVLDPTDDWLQQRLGYVSKDIQLKVHPTPQFLNTPEDLKSFFRADKKSFFQTSFYKQQRKKRNILLDENQQALGGKWTYDTENRKKYPRNRRPPAVHYPATCSYWKEAVNYVEKHFNEHLGQVSESKIYPVNFEEAEAWFEQFLSYRFYDFGAYEDAILKDDLLLHHSLLSPLLNTGLLRPESVVQRVLGFVQKENIPINSTEGLIRQLIGWREFIRGMYSCKGRYSRSRNFWNFKRKIPESFYTGQTGILPIDQTIQKVLRTGYCHHIERLMILGNFMLLCEFDPDEVYRWFMELFIDAYDWVMVPNVYGMCLFADGGTFATKPYISSSNYIKKMSDYPSGEWEKTWDGMFWSFVIKHEAFFKSNPRTSMLAHMLKKMPDDKRNAHLEQAKSFVSKHLEHPVV